MGDYGARCNITINRTKFLYIAVILYNTFATDFNLYGYRALGII
jgi:hypothetical protein